MGKLLLDLSSHLLELCTLSLNLRIFLMQLMLQLFHQLLTFW